MKPQLGKYDLLFATRRLPAVVRAALKEPAFAGKLIVAGGYLRSVVSREEISDIDLFVPSKEFSTQVENYFLNKKYTSTITPNAVTLKKPGNLVIQIINRWVYQAPTEIVPSFDFTIARAAMWFDGLMWQSEVDPDFYQDLAAKRLVYCRPERNEDAGGSMLRVLKFYRRGYTMPLDSLGAVIARLVKDVDFEAIHKSYGSVPADKEAQTGKVLTGLLREVDPNVDPDHIMHEPSDPEEEIKADLVNENPQPEVGSATGV